MTKVAMPILHSNPFEVGRFEVRRMPVRRELAPGQMAPAGEGEAEDIQVTISGYAAKFGVLSELFYDFQEVIDPGAFDAVLEDDVRCLFNHDPNLIMGRNKAGTMRLALDDTGLQYECDLPDSAWAEHLASAIDRGDVTQSSFAFTVEESTWTERGDGTWLRTITKVGRLYDVSPVTYPGYPDATVGMRSGMVEALRAERDRAEAERGAQLASEDAERSAQARSRRMKILGV